MTAKKAEYGSGPVFKAAAVVYGVMVGAGLLALANILVLLTPVLAGVIGPVALLGFLFVGPSVVAVGYAFNRQMAGEDTGVFHDFLKSYRSNFAQALGVWLPYLGFLAVIAFNLSVLPGSLSAGAVTGPVQIAARIGLIVLGILALTAGVQALLMLSRFSFRTRDIFRLSLLSLSAQPRVSLGNAGILFVTAFLLVSTTAWLAVFLAGPMLYVICLNSKPLLTYVEGRFTE